MDHQITRKELYELLRKMEESDSWAYDRDHPVVISTAVGGIPHNQLVGIESIGVGMDWTAPFLLIHPNTPLVPMRKLDKRLSEFARERLEKIKESCSFKYIAEAREREWIEGFIEGVKAHITLCSPEDTIDKCGK